MKNDFILELGRASVNYTEDELPMIAKWKGAVYKLDPDVVDLPTYLLIDDNRILQLDDYTVK